MKPTVDYTLYLVTDRELMRAPSLESAVEQAVAGGATLVQLREKTASSREFYDTAVRIKAITDARGVPLIINDRVDIALAIDAAGVHVGQEDIPAADVRRILGPDKLLGVSAATLAEALRAQEDGADYLGVGAMYSTGTKADANFTTLDELKRIRAAVGLPIVAIGGINKSRVPDFAGTGIDGLAVVSAVISAPDIAKAARELKALFDNMVKA
jgi:thiamine-phosphate pyrophosphorylase